MWGRREGGRPVGAAGSRERVGGMEGKPEAPEAGVGELMRALVCVHGSMVLVWIPWGAEWAR